MQDSPFREQKSVAPFSSTAVEKTGHESYSYRNNSDKSNNICEVNDEVRSERSGEGQQNPEREQVKSILETRNNQKLFTRIGPEAQLSHFAIEDMSLKRKLFEQLEKSDAAFNESIAKVNRIMEVIWTMMLQCVSEF